MIQEDDFGVVLLKSSEVGAITIPIMLDLPGEPLATIREAEDGAVALPDRRGNTANPPPPNFPIQPGCCIAVRFFCAAIAQRSGPSH